MATIQRIDGVTPGLSWMDWLLTLLAISLGIINPPLTFNIPVYIGPVAEFHQSFEVCPGGYSEHHGLEGHWIHYYDLKNWYETIQKYLI